MKVGFALLSSSQDAAPSTRIACLNIFPALAALNFEPVVVFDPVEARHEPDVSGVAERAAVNGCEVVVFQKLHGESVLRCVARLRELGIASVYYACDFVDDAMVAAVNRTAVVTDFLRSLHAPELQSKIDVVHDGIERPEVHKTSSSPATTRSLRAALVTSSELYALPVIGMPPAPWRVNVIGRFGSDRRQRRQSLRWKLMRMNDANSMFATLRAVLDRRIAHTQWSVGGVYEHLLAADIGIIPVDTSDPNVLPEASLPAWQLKSENRLTLKMALGLPVIATPIPSYEPIVEHGINGFFATTRADWTRCFDQLRDPALRADMGARARACVLAPFSRAAQAQKLARCIERARVEFNATRDHSLGDWQESQLA